MAKIRRLDPKAALGQQRAELKRGARGKLHIGDDTGSAAGKAAERARVRAMQELHAAREAAERRREPLAAILGDLVADTFRLARTLLGVPFRMASALWGRGEAHA
jgi:hypothetical protein